ncbi:MAG: dephospho-CoA kinase [Deltaproteobacteria bacterium HGW-Deltaproteobacteria-1]|jgi:dephospho-CoA kinase|nr:MAG: dephospho-CoA kinase [Deltaproteobacteria bacterium HGW-Deltaproteobacteria-1]
MLNVGLTGGIACGKSTVAQMFVRLGGHLIDFDKLAHEVQEPGKLAWKDVVDYFGREVLQPDQKIDRNKLAAVVFNHPDKLQALNDIIHPRVYEAWRFRLEEINRHHPHAIVFADVPLLFEGGMQHLFDLTILVMIEPEEQVNRLMTRSALCQTEAELRLSCQMPIRDKMNLADIIIDNRSAMNETEKKVAEVWEHLLDLEKNQKH